MKLYTEEQVGKAFYNGIKYSKTIHPASIGHHNQYVEEMIKSLTSIELPSDEEIEKKADEYVENKWEYAQDECKEAFTDCAKWLKDKILNQNK